MDNGIVGEKNLTGVIVLIDNIDRDEQLNAADERDIPGAINHCQVSLKLQSGDKFKLSCLIIDLKHLQHTNNSV